jgi:hypothetical protein
MAFSKITYHSNLGATPARVNRKTGELQINIPVWNTLTPEAKRFVFLHEEGHLVLQTRNELAADKYAFEKYVGEGHSLKAGVKALTRVLGNNPNHIIRSNTILNHAKQYQDTMSNFNVNDWITPAYDNFLGIGKKAKARRIERKEVKHDAKLAKIENKVIKQEDRNERRNLRTITKGDQRINLSRFGVTPGGELTKGIAGTVAGLAKGFATATTGGLSDLVAPAAPSTNQPTFSPGEFQMATSSGFSPMQEAMVSDGGFYSPDQNMQMPGFELTGKKNNLPFIIGGAVAVLIVIVLIMRK